MSLEITSINNANPKDTTNFLIIKSTDNINYCISKGAAYKSMVINDMVESLGDIDEPIPLIHDSCTSEYLQKVLIFLDYIHYDQQSTNELENWINSKGYSGFQPEWFKNYIDVDQHTLFGILLVADFLHIQILVDFLSLTIANQIKSMSPEELQKVFSSEN